VPNLNTGRGDGCMFPLSLTAEVGSMAIKVVQGLIDGSPASLNNTGRPDARQQAQAAATRNLPTSQSQALAQQQQASTSVSAQVARSQTAQTSEAALTTIRANRSTERSGKVEDPEQAQALADSVADRLADKDEEALAYHPGLHPSTAQEHFYGQ